MSLLTLSHQFPLSDCDLGEIVDGEVCVVSFFGETKDGYACATAMINDLLSRDALKSDRSIPWVETQFSKLGEDVQAHIQFHYTFDEGMLYLHLITPHDPSLSFQLNKSLLSAETQEEYDEHVKQAEEAYMRAVLFLFLVSDVVCLTQYSSAFNTLYATLFKKLESLKFSFFNNSNDNGDVDDSNVEGEGDWGSCTSRQSVPEILFLFELPVHIANSSTKAHKKLEEQIHCTFDKLQLKSSSSSSSSTTPSLPLFALSSSDFVFFHRSQTHNDNDGRGAREHRPLASPPLSSSHPQTKGLTGQWLNNHLHDVLRQFTTTSTTHNDEQVTPTNNMSEGIEQQMLFQERLLQVKDALSTPIDDFVGASRLRTASSFLRDADQLFGQLVHSDGNTSTSSQLHEMISPTLDWKKSFSEETCARALKIGLQVYMTNIPNFYNERTHKKHLYAAIQKFALVARGVSLNTDLTALVSKCSQIWKVRRVCEVVSVFGVPCNEKLHATPSFAEENNITSLPILEHSCSHAIMCSCVCGRTQKDQADVFSIGDLNKYMFELKCCMRVLKTVTPLARVCYTLSLSGSKSQNSEDDIKHIREEHKQMDLLKMAETMEISQILPKNFRSGRPDACFCLYSHGDASSYSHISGLSNQNGFVANSHYLLPYETKTVVEESTSKTETNIWEKRKASSSAGKKQKAKLYIGYEYETFEGKRFIAFNQREHVRISKTTGYVHGHARTVMNEDMPVCMNLKDAKQMASIVRIHIVVPNVKVKVKVQPIVRFWDKVITTQPVLLPPNGSYVLQFPKVFVWENKPIKLPTTAEGLKSCVVVAKAVDV
eukprot:m.160098 g.160098  ORF g.160098 m.160098 type:complete len:826 (+) comp13380_c1_seq9:94-2571(+)